MTYRQDCDNCLSAQIGEGGLSAEGLARMLAAAAPVRARLAADRRRGRMPLLELPGRSADLVSCEEVASRFRQDFDEVLVLGTGGSSLGGQTLYALAASQDGPRLRFLDNVDPETWDRLLTDLNPSRSGVIVISKSGGTAETMAQAMILLAAFRAALGETALPHHIVAISDPGENPLRAMAARFRLPCLDHEPAIGGRFSVLSNVGLLPAMIAGLDPTALRAGAAAALAAALDPADPAASPPLLGAAVAVGLLQERHISQSVLMPYADRLADFAQWYCQLWAESLGKDGTGTTPIRALGTVDQHSQLQLYLSGPRDKMFTLVRLVTRGLGPSVDPDLAGDPALAYLRGRSLGDLMAAMADATAVTLADQGLPVRVFHLERLDEEVLGALLMHFLLETLIAAALLGVDPFGQPAVEQGKMLARRSLSEMS